MTGTADTIAPRAVAVLGTGTIGGPIARNLATHGFSVRAWNRTRSKAEALAERGVAVAATPADAVRGANVVLTVLTDGPRVLEVMRAAEPRLARGMIWAQISTVGPAAIGSMAEFAAGHGMVLYDSPVLGSRGPAESGELVILASGAETSRGAIQPIYDAIGKRTVWVGTNPASGAASGLKLALNHYVFTLVHGVAESLAIAAALEVDPRHVVDVISGGPLDNAYFQMKAKAMLEGDYGPSFTVTNALKDARLIAGAAKTAGVRADLAEASVSRFQRLEDAGHGAEDMAASFLAG